MSDHKPDLERLAKCIETELKGLYGRKMGFALLCFDFNSQGQCDYVSNGDREDMVKALIEASVRLGITQ